LSLAYLPYFEDIQKFWEQLIAYFPLIWHEPHEKWRVQDIFYCCVYIEPLPSNFYLLTYKVTAAQKFSLKQSTFLERLTGPRWLWNVRLDHKKN
jgi:hypothetical protein